MTSGGAVGAAAAEAAGTLGATEILIHGARKLDADGIVDDFWMLTAGDRIVATGTGDGWRARVSPAAAAGTAPVAPIAPIAPEVIDADGAWLTPGFIDLHAHGGGGHSFDDGHDAIRAALAAHRRHGTTRSVISLVANPPHVLKASLDAIARIADEDPLVLGAHLEGPFLAPGRRGAHNPDFLGVPEPHIVRDLIEAGLGRLVQVTLAPELPDAGTAISTFVGSGVVVAVGHTEATLEQARDAFDRGATLLTHAFNAMPGIGHRSPGPVVAAFDDPRVVLEVIADGVHVHPDVVRLAFDNAPGRIALVTDAMAATDAADGAYRLGTLDVSVSGGRAVLAGTDTIAGSTLTLDAALRLAIAPGRAGAGIDPVAAVTALTATPATVLGRAHELGRLREDYLADAVLLTADFTVRAVIAAGIRLS